MAKSWYVFTGGGDPMDALRYYRLTVKHSCLCGSEICAIYASGNGARPNNPLSFNIQKYIQDALITGQIQPCTPFNTKKYVYLKY